MQKICSYFKCSTSGLIYATCFEAIIICLTSTKDYKLPKEEMHHIEDSGRKRKPFLSWIFSGVHREEGGRVGRYHNSHSANPVSTLLFLVPTTEDLGLVRTRHFSLSLLYSIKRCKHVFLQKAYMQYIRNLISKIIYKFQKYYSISECYENSKEATDYSS